MKLYITKRRYRRMQQSKESPLFYFSLQKKNWKKAYKKKAPHSYD
ncbi:hypothetical protein BSM4216_3816 [Bacillus smithii]|nr:hypothetical protein BSM4216_3816 [Bacillus smithii]